MSQRDSVCLLTGASGGIGRATAAALAARGLFTVLVLVGQNEEALRETARLTESVKTDIRRCDLRRPETIPELVASVAAEHGSIDCLINCAGYTLPASLSQTTLENLQTTYAVNVFSPLCLARECVSHLKRAPHPKIINIASTAGSGARPGWLSYATSKAALISASQTLSEELSEYNIKVYCVSPGRCATALRRKLAPEENQSMIMQPEAVASILCDLCAPGENWLDGQNIVIRQK